MRKAIKGAVDDVYQSYCNPLESESASRLAIAPHSRRRPISQRVALRDPACCHPRSVILAESRNIPFPRPLVMIAERPINPHT